MYHPSLSSVRSPLTPIPQKSKNATYFDFSPSAIRRCLEASRSTTPTVLKPLRSYPPNLYELSPPNLSPIASISHSIKRNLLTPNSTIASNSSLSKEDSFGSDTDIPTYLNCSNINNRHINMSAVLEDIGLKQYKVFFELEEIDLMAFLLCTENDFNELGIKDPYHRAMFMGIIEKLNNIN